MVKIGMILDFNIAITISQRFTKISLQQDLCKVAQRYIFLASTSLTSLMSIMLDANLHFLILRRQEGKSKVGLLLLFS